MYVGITKKSGNNRKVEGDEYMPYMCVQKEGRLTHLTINVENALLSVRSYVFNGLYTGSIHVV